MTKTSKIILVTVIAASILLGLGYAAIQNITLNISGTAAADPNQANFKVRFTGTPLVSDSSYVTARISNDTNATFDVSGLNTKGQKVTATYDITNESSDLSADLIVSTTNSNTEFFNVTSQLAKTSIVAGETTTVTVTVELTKVLLAEGVSSDIGIEIIAAPVEPGNEGNSGILDDTPDVEPEYVSLNTVTNDNIGEYVDLGNSYVGTESTSDDWRVLYKDESNVYVILSDYLPVSELQADLGLQTDSVNYKYSVWSNISANDLNSKLSDESKWSKFTNEIDNVTCLGAISETVILDSFNYVNGTNWTFQQWPDFSSSSLKYDLYVVHDEIYEGCNGYWLNKYQPEIAELALDYCGEMGYYQNTVKYMAVRPVVILPVELEAELKDNVWIIKR